MCSVHISKINALKKAVAYLKKTVFADDPDLCPSYLYLEIDAENRDTNNEEYETNLAIFKALFNAPDEDMKIALWNALPFWEEDVKFYKSDFSDEEYEFIKKALETKLDCDEININDIISTGRLTIRRMESEDTELLCYHYENDGDFATFTRHAPTPKNIRECAELRAPLYFTLVETQTQTVIGYAGFSIHDDTNTALVEYYVFKEFRRKGYCKEAVRKLSEMALKGELFLPAETVYEGVYAKKALKIGALRARIAASNIASVKTIEACGYLHEATIHKAMYRYKSDWDDMEIYYLTKSELRK